jgi:hypothetical protein
LGLFLFFLSSCTAGDSSGGAGVYPKAVSAVDETSTIQTLRTIATAQAQAKATKGSYRRLQHSGSGRLFGSAFRERDADSERLSIQDDRRRNRLSVNADPQASAGQATTGARHFYLDSTDNTIHANQSQTASKSDPAL